mgnify:CR=1 FL=1
MSSLKRTISFSEGGGRPAKRRRVDPAPRRSLKAAILRAAETKQITLGSAATAALSLTTTPQFLQLSANTQGVGDLQHVGDEITPVAYNIHYQLAAADTSNICRIVLFQWLMDTTAAAPDATLWNWNSETGNTEAPLGVLDWSRRSNVNVLYDSGPMAMVFGAANGVKAGKIRIAGKRMRKIKINRGTTSSGTGHLYLMYVSDSGAVNHPSFEFTSQLLFKDM